MREINCVELKEKLENNNEDVFLVDVREPFEFKSGNLGGINVPTSKIQERFSEIPKDREVERSEGVGILA